MVRFLLTKAIIWCKIVMIVYSRVNQFTRWSRAAVQNYRHITSFTAIVNESICQSKNNTGFLSTFLARTLTRSAPFISFFKLHWFSFINLGQRYNVMLYKIILQYVCMIFTFSKQLTCRAFKYIYKCTVISVTEKHS